MMLCALLLLVAKTSGLAHVCIIRGGVHIKLSFVCRGGARFIRVLL